MGILNNKERIFDTIITKEGKRQIASGKMQIEFASFSDNKTFYQKSGSNGFAEDASKRIFFETNNSYQDLIIPEISDGNVIHPFKTKDFLTLNSKIASGTLSIGFNSTINNYLSGGLNGIINNYLDNITQNFLDLRILSTKDPFSDTSNFTLQNNSGSFSLINNDFNKIKDNNGIIKAENSPSLFADKYFSHLPNFQYLPPINTKTSADDQDILLGNYVKLNHEEIKSYEDIKNLLKDKENVNIKFYDTSRENNLVIQVFECVDDNNGLKIEKLSSVDFGEFSILETKENNKTIHFIGKIIKDGNGSDTFFNIFTLLSE